MKVGDRKLLIDYLHAVRQTQGYGAAIKHLMLKYTDKSELYLLFQIDNIVKELEGKKSRYYCDDCAEKLYTDKDTYECSICNVFIHENCFYDNHINHLKPKFRGQWKDGIKK